MAHPIPHEFQMALNGDVVNLRNCLKRNPTLVSSYSPSQTTLLFNAVSSLYLPCVRMLVEEFRADVVQTCTPYANSPLHQAAYLGSSEIVRYLLERGARPTPNAFNEYPADQLAKPCPSRTMDASRATLQVLREFHSAQASTNVVDYQQQQQQQQQQQPVVGTAFPATRLSQSGGPSSSNSTTSSAPPFVLPPQCDEVNRQFQKINWSETAADVVAKLLLPYEYRKTTYYTPVILFYSKVICDAPSAAVMYRCMVDSEQLNNLAFNSKATSVYLHAVTGVILPRPPYVYQSFLDYIVRGVIAHFQQVPPLVDAASAVAITRKASMSVKRRIETEISAFHDGCLIYDERSFTIRGVIPVYPGNNRAFKPMCCVPIQVNLVHMAQSNPAMPPLIFVGPCDSDMILQTTPNVDGATGQIRNVVKDWNGQTSSLTPIFLEIQKVFSEQPPIQNRGNLEVTQPQQQQSPQSSNNSTPLLANSSTAASSTPTMAAAASAASSESISEAMLCVICLCEQKRFIALPCRHLLFCPQCVDTFAKNNSKNECPICRAKISDLFEIYT